MRNNVKKRIKNIAITLLTIMLCINILSPISNAASANNIFVFKITSNLTQVKPGSEVIFKISADSIEMGQGLISISMKIEYPKDAYQELLQSNIDVLEGWRIEQFNKSTGELKIKSNNFVNKPGDVIQLVMSTKPDAKEDSNAKIKITNITGGNGSTTAKAGDLEADLKFGIEDIQNESFGATISTPSPITPPPTTAPITPVTPVPTTPMITPTEVITPPVTEDLPDAGIEDTIVPITIALAVIALVSMYSYSNSAKRKLAVSTEAIQNMDLEKDQVEINIKD